MPVLCSALLCLPGLAGGADGGRSSVVSLPVSTVDLSPELSHSELIPLSRNFPDMSTAIAATTTDTSTTLPSLPQGNAEASFVGGLYEAFKSRGENMLTPDGAAATLRGVESGGIAGLGSNLAQSVIDAGLQRIEQQAGQHLFRNLNLNWAPGFNGRKDLYQIDAMLSLYDGERSSLMTQLGLQSRDGETGANAGLVLRTQSFEHWILGFNAFYDYLSDPDVSRWSVGAELKGRWIGLSSNIYIGLDEETRGRETLYSPDGWDVELSGHVPDLPWLEYSGRYYNWNGEGSPDIEGQDYKLTLRPVPLFDISLRYDNAEDSDSGFGVETQLSYEFGRPMSEQLSYQQVATPASAWSRRFERVRREYEQRVQRRSGGATTSVTRVTASGTGVVVQIANIPAGTTQVVVTGGVRTGNSLTRATSAASTASTVRAHGDTCHIPSISTASCTFNATTSEITIATLQQGNYNFGVSFQNAAGTDLGGQVQFTVTIAGPTASIAVNNAAIAEAGGVATVTVTLAPAPASATVVNLTRTGSGTVVSDYTVATLAGTDPTYTLMVAANTATATFTVTAVDDSADDDAETAIFTISSVTDYTVASGAAAVTVTITDDDGTPTAPAASIYIGNAGTQTGTITEAAASTTTVTVRLSPAPTSTTTVSLMQSGSGTVVSDYTVASLSGTAPAYTLMVAANTATATFTVTAVDDSADDDDETAVFTVVAGTGYTPASGAAAVATVTITDNDPLPQFSFQTASATVAEGGSVEVNVVYTEGPLDTTVGISLSGGTAASGDYSVSSISAMFSSSTLIFNSSEASPGRFSIMARMDAEAEISETLIITLQDGTGYTVGSANTYTLTITNVAPPPVASTYIGAPGSPLGSITEAAASTTTVTVSLDRAAPAGGLTVNLVRSGDATIATDYSQSGLTPNTDPAYSIMIAEGATTATFMLTAVDDAVDDDDENAIFTVVAGSGYTPSTVAAATNIIIMDNDDPPPVASVYIGATGTQTGTITEAGTSATTVTVELAAAAPTGGVTVNLMRSGGATIATDYSQSGLTPNTDPAYTLTVPATMTTATFMLTAVDDAVDDDAETAIFTVVAGTGYTPASGSAAIATVTITDDDDPIIVSTYIGAAGTQAGTITEATGATRTSTVTVSLDRAAPTGGLPVNLMRSGTATIGAANDYSQSGLTPNTDPAYTLTVPATMTTATFMLTAVDDAVDDDAETAIFTVVAGSGYTPITTAAAVVTVTITDDDDPVASIYIGTPGMQVQASSPSEGDTINGAVSLSSAAPTGGLMVNIVTTGTAVAFVDYFSTSTGFSLNGIMIAEGATTATFAINIIDNIVPEETETVILTLAAGTGYTPATDTSAAITITIIDDDQPVSIYIGATGTQTGTITEVGTSATTVTVELAAAAPVGGLTVNLMRSGGATIATDYSQSGLTPNTDPAYSIMIAEGATTATFMLTAVVDTEDDDAETAVFTIATGMGYAVASGGAEAVTVTITDDDIPPSPVTGIAATPGNGQVVLSWTNPTDTDLAMVMISATAGGTAVDLNGGGTTGNDLSIAATASSTGTSTITSLTNGTEYTFSIVALDGTGNPSTAVTIMATPARPPPEVSFPTATATLAEGSSPVNAVVSVAFTGGALTTAVDVSVRVGGTAVAADYTTANNSANVTLGGATPTIRIIAGFTSPAVFGIVATTDAFTEGSETVIITLLDGDGYTVGTANTYTLTITEPPPPEVSFPTATATLAEGSNASVDIAFTGGAPLTTNVNLSVSVSGTAVAADYTTLGANVTLGGATPTIIISAGNTSPVGFGIVATTDTLTEGSETLIITLLDGDGYTVGTANTYTLTITDPPPPEVSFPTATATVAEGSNVFEVVSIAFTGGALTTAVDVSVRVGGTAVAADYITGDSTASATLTGATPTIEILVGRPSPVGFGILTTRDTLTEGDETLIITLLDGDGYTVGSANTYTLTITDVPPPPPVASIYIGATGTQTGTITEVGTSATTVTVELAAAAPTGGVTVNLMRTGTATIATDYSQSGLTPNTDPAYSIMIAEGATTATFMLTAVVDTEDDDAETAVFTIATGMGYAVASGGAEAVTVTITDDDIPPSPVTGIAATPGNGQVVLSWTNPAATDLAMVMISATAGGTAVDLNGGGTTGNDLSIAATASSTGTSTITSLTNGTEYTFSIVALDGTGNPSTAVTIMATPAIPPPPQFSFPTATATVAEGGSVTVNIAFTGGALAANAFLSVSVGGTATVTADYTTNNAGATVDLATDSIRINARFTSPVFFTISTTADTLTEGDETLIITLLDGDGYTVGSANTYTLTITD